MAWEARKKAKTESPVSFVDAQLAGLIMRACPGVRGVEVFGSVARKGKGHDLDILLLVDKGVAGLWHQLVYMSIGNDVLSQRDRTGVRREATEQILGKEFQTVIEDLERTHPEVSFDILLLPIDWREAEYEKDAFMVRLKHEAVRIA